MFVIRTNGRKWTYVKFSKRLLKKKKKTRRGAGQGGQGPGHPRAAVTGNHEIYANPRKFNTDLENDVKCILAAKISTILEKIAVAETCVGVHMYVCIRSEVRDTTGYKKVSKSTWKCLENVSILTRKVERSQLVMNVISNFNHLPHWNRRVTVPADHNTSIRWVVHWPLMDGLLRLVQRGEAWVGCCPAQSPPRCTKRNTPHINGQCTSFVSFDVAI